MEFRKPIAEISEFDGKICPNFSVLLNLFQILFDRNYQKSRRLIKSQQVATFTSQFCLNSFFITTILNSSLHVAL